MKFIVIPSNHPRYVSNLLSIDMSTLDGIANELSGESLTDKGEREINKKVREKD